MQSVLPSVKMHFGFRVSGMHFAYNAEEVIRSGQCWALAHFSRAIRRGARRFESQSQAANLAHIAVENPDGQRVLILTNLGAARTVQVNQGLLSAKVMLEENSVATLVWK